MACSGRLDGYVVKLLPDGRRDRSFQTGNLSREGLSGFDVASRADSGVTVQVGGAPSFYSLQRSGYMIRLDARGRVVRDFKKNGDPGSKLALLPDGSYWGVDDQYRIPKLVYFSAGAARLREVPLPGKPDKGYVHVLKSDGAGLWVGATLGENRDPEIFRLQESGGWDAGFSKRFKASLEASQYRLKEIANLYPDRGWLLLTGSVLARDKHEFLKFVRILKDGTLDPQFKSSPFTDGWHDSRHWIDAVGIQPDGRILVGGKFGPGWGGAIGLYRLNTDGEPDLLDGNWATEVLRGKGHGSVQHLAPRTDGRVYVAGSVGSGRGESFLIRLHADGTRDEAYRSGRIFGF